MTGLPGLLIERSAHFLRSEPMASTPARTGQPADNALSRRSFSVALHDPSTSSTAPAPTRHLKRIHLAAEILKARKICAGDALVVMPRPEESEVPGVTELDEQLDRLSLRQEVSAKTELDTLEDCAS